MIGIIAPSSRVPKVELTLGVELLKRGGFEVKVHRQCSRSHLYFAGTDEERALAFFEYATNPDLDIIWCARGGSGASNILPILDRLSERRDVPSGKLLIGYSDSTALFDYVRMRWGWSVLHAPMPGLRSFLQLKPQEWKSLVQFVRKAPVEKPWGKLKLKQVGGPTATASIEGQINGGNLIVWSSLAGTPYFPKEPDQILFFEEIAEYLYRIHRLVKQIELARGFETVRAIVLGDFMDCRDLSPQCLKVYPKQGLKSPILKAPKPKDLKPLRKTLNEKKVLYEIFGEIGERYEIPVFAGLPVGHGPGHYPLPIGASYRLSPSGNLELLKWDWLDSE